MSKFTLSLLGTALSLHTVFALAAAPPASAQGLGGLMKKNLKARLQQMTKRATNLAADKAEDVIWCAVGDEACIRKAEADGRPVVLADEEAAQTDAPDRAESSPRVRGSAAGPAGAARDPGAAGPKRPAGAVGQEKFREPEGVEKREDLEEEEDLEQLQDLEEQENLQPRAELQKRGHVEQPQNSEEPEEPDKSGNRTVDAATDGTVGGSHCSARDTECAGDDDSDPSISTVVSPRVAGPVDSTAIKYKYVVRWREPCTCRYYILYTTVAGYREEERSWDGYDEVWLPRVATTATVRIWNATLDGTRTRTSRAFSWAVTGPRASADGGSLRPRPGPGGAELPFGFQVMSVPLNTGHGVTFSVVAGGKVDTPALEQMRLHGQRVVLRLSGTNSGPTAPKNPDGTFSWTKWKSRVDEFREKLSGPWLPYVQDGTIMAHMVIDEPKSKVTWGGQEIPQRTVEQMAQYSKSLWPTLATLTRVDPSWLAQWAGPYRYLDAGWSQYLANRGDPGSYLDEQIAAAKTIGVGLFASLNVLDGGDGSSGWPGSYRGHKAMSPAEIRRYGTAILQRDYICAFSMWRWDDEYLSRPGVWDAVNSLASIARARKARSCSGR